MPRIKVSKSRRQNKTTFFLETISFSFPILSMCHYLLSKIMIFYSSNTTNCQKEKLFCLPRQPDIILPSIISKGTIKLPRIQKIESLLTRKDSSCVIPKWHLLSLGKLKVQHMLNLSKELFLN